MDSPPQYTRSSRFLCDPLLSLHSEQGSSLLLSVNYSSSRITYKIGSQVDASCIERIDSDNSRSNYSEAIQFDLKETVDSPWPSEDYTDHHEESTSTDCLEQVECLSKQIRLSSICKPRMSPTKYECMIEMCFYTGTWRVSETITQLHLLHFKVILNSNQRSNLSLFVLNLETFQPMIVDNCRD